MYYTLYTSSDYYEDQSIENDLIEDKTNKICLICWLPPKTDNPIKNMKNFSFMICSCNCNPLFHHNCLKDWVDKSLSCPICRNKITIILEQHSKIIKVSYYLFIFNYSIYLMRFTTLCSIINLFCLCVYNLYIFYYCKTNFEFIT